MVRVTQIYLLYRLTKSLRFSPTFTRLVLRLLLDIGSDPCNKNKKLQTPYAVANNKETRNEFRRFMGANPEKFNYRKVYYLYRIAH